MAKVINIIGSTGGGGSSNLAYVASPIDGTITNSNGTDAILPLVDTTNAGLMSPDDFDKLATLENTIVDLTIIDGSTNAVSGNAVFDGLALKANDSNVIHTTGNESKAGSLTLNDTLILSDLTALTGDINNIGVDDTGTVVAFPTDRSFLVSVRNVSGAMIPKGSAVYISGSQGNKATIGLALANQDPITNASIGLVYANINNNANGYVVIVGELSGLNTSAFIGGDKVFLSNTTPGGITNTPPASPAGVTLLGTVTYSHVNQGIILVETQYTHELDKLTDVSAATPASNDTLIYNNGTTIWENKALKTINGNSLIGAGDISTGNITGTGTLNKLPLWTGASTLGNSRFSESVTTGFFTGSGADLISFIPGGNVFLQLARSQTLMSFTLGNDSISQPNIILSDNDFSLDISSKGPLSIKTGGVYTEALRINTSGKTFLTVIPNVGLSTDQVLVRDVSGEIKTVAPADLGTPTSRVLNINGNDYDLTSNREWRVGQGDTGVLTFGTGITYNSTTTINIAPITGYIVNNETDPANPIYTYVSYPGGTGVVVPNLTGTPSWNNAIGSYVLLDSTGTIVFQNTFPTSAERKARIWLGKIGHVTGLILTPLGVINEPDYITSPLAFSRDLFQAINYINDGVYPYPNGANLSFNNTLGNIHGNGINLHNSNTSPNELSVPAQVPVTFFYRTQTGAGSIGNTLIDTGNYDLAGVITDIPNPTTQATNQWIFFVPGAGFAVQYGQTVYSTLSAAISAIGKESFTLFPNLVGNSILVGILSVINNPAAVLNNTAQAVFFRADKFGQIIGAQAGTSTGTLQSSYNNSTTPQFLITDALGSIIYNNDRISDTSSLIEFQNIANTTTASVKGNGSITGLNFVKTGASSSDILLGDGTTTSLTSLVTLTGTQTLTNKRINKRLLKFTSSASINIPTDTCDIYSQDETSLQAVNTSSITFTGTPVDGQMVMLRIKDNGTSRNIIGWSNVYTTSVSLIITTIPNEWVIYVFQYNEHAAGTGLNRWHLLATV
jgi:hypothetical protein